MKATISVPILAVDNDLRWYLAFTKPKVEQLAANQLERQGYTVFLPQYKELRRASEGMVVHRNPLFPRYVFFKPGTPAQSIAPVRSTVGVCSIVSFGTTPARVSDELIRAIRVFEQQREAVSVADLSALKAGRRVAICVGPLKGLEGLVSAKAGTRVTVLLEVLGRETRVSVPEHHLQPLSA